MALLDTFTPDNLIADNTHALAGGTVVVKSGEGELKRGSVLMRDANDEFVLADTSAGTAEVILAADVDATDAAAVAEVYVSGDFNASALILAEGYTLTEADFGRLLYSGDIPDPELVIRPGGEARISNFLLWQSAYAEYYFTDVLWPDFGPEELEKAIAAFNSRNRRFGGV